MQLVDLSLAQRALLTRIVAAPGWATFDELAKASGYAQAERAKLIPKGRGLARVREDVDALAGAGWVCLQEKPEGPVITLSAEGQKLLGVRLSLKGKAPRWVRTRKPLGRDVESWLPEDLQHRRVQSAPTEELDQVESPQREWYADEPALEVPPAHYRTGPHWIWLWTHAECPTGCEHHQIPAGEHCLGCGRWVPRIAP